jgi:hypothetical protein
MLTKKKLARSEKFWICALKLQSRARLLCTIEDDLGSEFSKQIVHVSLVLIIFKKYVLFSTWLMLSVVVPYV